LTIALATTALVCSLDTAWAIEAGTLPGGEKVIGGNASFDRSQKNVLSIKQGSERLLIDWHDGFNIGAAGTTNFYQPSKDAIVVNRVVSSSADPTRILGNLNANGRVVILDRNGVIFGKGSKIDVGGLIASTGDINDNAFIKGKGKNFTVENIADGKIINAGQITIAEAGLAAFVAPSVRNDGLIVARMGTVVMGNAKAVTFDLYGDGLMEVSTSKEIEGTKIVNKGKIDVGGGRVLLTAAMVDDVVHNLINVDKISKSDTFKVINGKIVLGKDSDAAAKIKEARKAELAKRKELRKKEHEDKHGHHPKDKDDDAAAPAPAVPAEPETSEPDAPVAEIPAPTAPEPEIIITLPEVTPEPTVPAEETPAPEVPVAETPAPVTPEPEIIVTLPEVTPEPAAPAEETPAPEAPVAEIPAPVTPEPEIIVALPEVTPEPAAPVVEIAAPAPAPAPVTPATPEPEIVVSLPAPEVPATGAALPVTPAKPAVVRVVRSLNHELIAVEEVAPVQEQIKDLALEIYGIKLPAAAAVKGEKRADAAVRMNALSPAAGVCGTEFNQPVSCLTVE
jgi:filamentous hemagglutinin family protein